MVAAAAQHIRNRINPYFYCKNLHILPNPNQIYLENWRKYWTVPPNSKNQKRGWKIEKRNVLILLSDPGFQKTSCFHLSSNTTTSSNRVSLNLTTNLEFKIQYKKILELKMFSKHTFWCTKNDIVIFSFKINILHLKIQYRVLLIILVSF
jgi:hypothetical protein